MLANLIIALIIIKSIAFLTLVNNDLEFGLFLSLIIFNISTMQPNNQNKKLEAVINKKYSADKQRLDICANE